MKKIALILFLLSTFCLKAQTKNANQITFPLARYNFEAQPRTQLSPMSIKLFDDYNYGKVKRMGKAPDNNSFGTLLAIYGLGSHWESNIYFGKSTRKMYFRTSTWSGGTSEENVKGGFNRWRTLLDSESNIASNGLLKLTGNGNHYFLKGNVGIGTTKPKAKLDIAYFIPNGTLGTVFGRLSEGSTSGDGTYLGVKGYGTQQANYNGKSFAIIHNFYGRTNNSINFFRGGSFEGGYITFNVNKNLEAVRITPMGELAIGVTNTKGYKLAVGGRAIAEEVVVKLKSNWPDFVFKKDYNLPTLKEVENHIKEKGHLKDIPSAKEVAKNGILIGEMNSKLLQKIEELTLYTIQQGKELKEQDSKIEKLEKQNNLLKLLLDRVSKLEKVIKN